MGGWGPVLGSRAVGTKRKTESLAPCPTPIQTQHRPLLLPGALGAPSPTGEGTRGSLFQEAHKGSQAVEFPTAALVLITANQCASSLAPSSGFPIRQNNPCESPSSGHSTGGSEGPRLPALPAAACSSVLPAPQPHHGEGGLGVLSARAHLCCAHPCTGGCCLQGCSMAGHSQLFQCLASPVQPRAVILPPPRGFAQTSRLLCACFENRLVMALSWLPANAQQHHGKTRTAK